MKTKSDSKAARTVRFHESMSKMGFTYEEAETLRRAEMTLHRWAERECNGEIERDEKTGKVFHYSNSRSERYQHAGHVPDRETGALLRVKAAVEARNARVRPSLADNSDEAPDGPVSFYHQTDPRGCQLFIIRPGDVPEGGDVGSYYSRGIAVCI